MAAVRPNSDRRCEGKNNKAGGCGFYSFDVVLGARAGRRRRGHGCGGNKMGGQCAHHGAVESRERRG
jgi:hypothetical protein